MISPSLSVLFSIDIVYTNYAKNSLKIKYSFSLRFQKGFLVFYVEKGNVDIRKEDEHEKNINS